MITAISNAISTEKVQENSFFSWQELPDLPLFLILSNMKVSDLGRCAQVCREWKIVADDERLWKHIVRSQVLGKKVWEDNVGAVGDEPEYRMVPFNGMDGEEIPWKEVCKMHKNPSSYWTNNRMIRMPEFDFLVPATINGQPTTINRVIEVFANARLPIGCDYFFSNMVEKYGDIPVEKSYWARHTWTVVQMHEKGKGINRVHKLIETIIFQFLCCQVGIESGYGRVPFTLSQCLETHTVAGKEWPIYAGGFKKPVPGAAGVLVVVGSYGFIGRDGGELMLELVTQWFALMEEIHNALPANNRRLNHPAAVGGF